MPMPTPAPFANSESSSLAQDPDLAFHQIIGQVREQRRAALAALKTAINHPDQIPDDQKQAAIDLLDTWRQHQAQMLTQAISEAREQEKQAPRMPQDQRSPSNPGPTASFETIVRAWHNAATPRLKNMPNAELRIRHKAATVLKHTPDIIAAMPALSDEEITRALIAVRGALDILAEDLAQADNEALIDDMLPLYRLEVPTISPTLLESLRAQQDATGEPTPPIIPIATTPPTNLEWIHQTTDKIETNIRAYLEEHRWDALGGHFGAIITELTDQLWYRIMNSRHDVSSRLTKETAVAISLLKHTLVIDHTDNLHGAVAWYEAMQLWLEDHDAGELPPQVIKQLAADFQVPLMQHAPQPGSEPPGTL